MTAVLLTSLALLAGSPEADVESGRRAMGGWMGGYPWYDSAQDDFRPINLRPPKKTPPPPPPPQAPSATGSQVVYVLMWGAAALILVGLVVLAVFVLRGSAADPKSTRQAVEEDLARIDLLPLPVKPAKGDLLSAVEAAIAAGDYDQAIIYLYSYQLVQLDRNQRIRLAHGKTNRQYLRELRPRGPLGQLFEQTMIAFEDVFFGHHRLERERFEGCWARLGEFRTLAAEGTT